MPSKSPAQARLMRAACKSAKFAKKVGIPQSVACEFMDADEAKARQESESPDTQSHPLNESTHD